MTGAVPAGKGESRTRDGAGRVTQHTDNWLRVLGTAERAQVEQRIRQTSYIRGMGPWLPLIDPRFYRRTLFAGLDAAPAVLDTSVLMVADRTPPEPTLGGMTWTWLEAVALECVPPYRGLAVVSHGR